MTSQPDLSVPAVEDRYDGDGDDDDGSESEGLYEDLGAAEELEEVREEEVAEKKGRVRRKAADIVKLYGCPKCDKTYSALKVPNLEQCLQGKENSHMILFFFFFFDLLDQLEELEQDFFLCIDSFPKHTRT